MDLTEVLKHLGFQFQRGLPIALTGAGFSAEAIDRNGRPLPMGRQLAKELWELAFPGTAFEEESSLQDIYHAARRVNQNGVEKLLLERFTVDQGAIPPFYRAFFSAAWARIYTLNIDNLAVACSRLYSLPRLPDEISGTTWDTQGNSGSPKPGSLEIIHLHGTLDDAVHDRITFSRLQYASRGFGQDPWYATLAAEAVARPVVFLGSALDEPLLWAHVQLRRSRGQYGNKELRPRSYLVSPKLDKAKEAVLRDYNVVWLSMTCREFCDSVLAPLQPQTELGLKNLRATRTATELEHRRTRLPDVAELIAAAPTREKSPYLLGAEPEWTDIRDSVPASRSANSEIAKLAQRELATMAQKRAILIAGTAGSGKSSALMQEAFRLSSEGKRVSWFDRETEANPRSVVESARGEDHCDVLAIDDADVFGSQLIPMVQEIVRADSFPLLLLAIRSSRIDRVLHRDRLQGVEVEEIAMPGLSDDDIDALLEVLDRSNLLGVLKGKARPDQRAAFADKSGRQLLVAMYEATSGKKFEEKIIDEYNDVEGVAREIYATVALASHHSHSPELDEILIAVGDLSNEALNAIDTLKKRHLLVDGKRAGTLRARHRLLASVVTDHLSTQGELKHYLGKLTFMASTRVNPATRRNSRPWRLLKRLLSHSYLLDVIDVAGAREIYSDVETILSWDYHYWLQRGSVEVERGVLGLAENYLGQAYSLAPEDRMVQTERAYLLLRQACADSNNVRARERANEALQSLQGLIKDFGAVDSYAFHVLGSQGLAWTRRAQLSRDERRDLLRTLRDTVEKGVELHRTRSELVTLLEDLRREYLGIALCS